MEIREALTFDDVLLVPGASSVLPADAIMNTNVTPIPPDWAKAIAIFASVTVSIAELKIGILRPIL